MFWIHAEKHQGSKRRTQYTLFRSLKIWSFGLMLTTRKLCEPLFFLTHPSTAPWKIDFFHQSHTHKNISVGMWMSKFMEYLKNSQRYKLPTHKRPGVFFVGISGMGSVWVKVGPTLGEFSISGWSRFDRANACPKTHLSSAVIGFLCSPKMAMKSEGSNPSIKNLLSDYDFIAERPP